jgi:hypothetical protein
VIALAAECPGSGRPERPPARADVPAEPSPQGRVGPPAAPAESAAPESAAATVATREDLTRRYRELGAALDRLYRERRGEVTSDYRDRYFAIPYSEALREPGVRAEVLERIDRLATDVETATAIARGPDGREAAR